MAQHPDTCSPASPVSQTWRPDNDCGHLPPITWPCRASVFLQLASGRSRSPVLQCGTIFRPTSHQRRHSRPSDSASSHFCSLSLIRTFTPVSQNLHLCGPCSNWHYLGHTKNYDDDDDDDEVYTVCPIQIWCSSFHTISAAGMVMEPSEKQMGKFTKPCIARLCWNLICCCSLY